SCGTRKPISMPEIRLMIEENLETQLTITMPHASIRHALRTLHWRGNDAVGTRNLTPKNMPMQKRNCQAKKLKCWKGRGGLEKVGKQSNCTTNHMQPLMASGSQPIRALSLTARRNAGTTTIVNPM